MLKLKLKIGDKVRLIAGKDKGKTGQILSINKKKLHIIVENCNLSKKALKPTKQGEKGQGFSFKEMPLHISNVMFETSNGPSRISRVKKEDQNGSMRFLKKTKEVIV